MGGVKDHVVMFPFMAKGHTIPLLHLASFLSTHHHLHVTILTTAGNAPSLRRHLPSSVNLYLLPFPSSPLLPAGVESTDLLPSFSLFPAFMSATSLLRPHFHHFLHSLQLSNSLPLCLISDFFLPWTLPSCQHFNVPRLTFHGMSTFSMFITKYIITNTNKVDFKMNPLSIPGMSDSNLKVSLADLPDEVQHITDLDIPSTQFTLAAAEADDHSWGSIINSFTDLEADYSHRFQSLFPAGVRAWLIGPLSLLNNNDKTDEDDDDDECLRWLNGKPKGSVVYVSFGTQAHVEREQLEEVAHGLEMAGWDYLWVVRDVSFRPPEAAGKKGKIIAWASQSAVLQHEAVGGFVSHCGWNSALESVAAGKPLLAWPMIAEQRLNAKFLVEELRVGIRIDNAAGENGVVRREVVEKGVREMMGDGEMREKVEMFGRMAKTAVRDGGSSSQILTELIEELRKVADDRREEVAVAEESLVQLQRQDELVRTVA
ncbi:hypothetical protein J5N97_003319 [Dioscorea zingiberensis]|uniref:Glycosyltransferase n=1 Tax=Dioscorea zingiberensis TaxID=325984 RepID=A0A9D5HQC1_9LILI|nr:hypothetical protein J5N97_003319 [Dioscorea zingiberensis]